MRESKFQADLIRKLRKLFPDAIIEKGDAGYLQGVPDIRILCGDKWTALEVKRSASEPSQPNQEYYVRRMNEMSYASFIYPENEERVLNELQLAFGVGG